MNNPAAAPSIPSATNLTPLAMRMIAARVAAGIVTDSRFAGIIGIATGSYAKIITGRAIPSLANAMRIQRVLRLDDGTFAAVLRETRAAMGTISAVEPLSVPSAEPAEGPIVDALLFPIDSMKGTAASPEPTQSHAVDTLADPLPKQRKSPRQSASAPKIDQPSWPVKKAKSAARPAKKSGLTSAATPAARLLSREPAWGAAAEPAMAILRPYCDDELAQAVHRAPAEVREYVRRILG